MIKISKYAFLDPCLEVLSAGALEFLLSISTGQRVRGNDLARLVEFLRYLGDTENVLGAFDQKEPIIPAYVMKISSNADQNKLELEKASEKTELNKERAIKRAAKKAEKAKLEEKGKEIAETLKGKAKKATAKAKPKPQKVEQAPGLFDEIEHDEFVTEVNNGLAVMREGLVTPVPVIAKTEAEELMDNAVLPEYPGKSLETATELPQTIDLEAELEESLNSDELDQSFPILDADEFNQTIDLDDWVE